MFRSCQGALVNKQYLVVARGGGKSHVHGVHSRLLSRRRPYHNAQIAWHQHLPGRAHYPPFKTAITSGPLFKFLSAGTVHATVGAKANRLLTPTKRIESTNSILEVRPMNDRQASGLAVQGERSMNGFRATFARTSLPRSSRSIKR